MGFILKIVQQTYIAHDFEEKFLFFTEIQMFEHYSKWLGKTRDRVLRETV